MVGLSEETRIAPHQVASHEFSVGVRGYRTDEVRTYLGRLAKEISRRDQEIVELRQELRKETPRGQLVEQLGKEVSAALNWADELRAAAEEDADRLRADARREADRLRSEAHREVERLRADVNHLVDCFVELREALGQIVIGIEQQLELIGEPR